MGVTSSRSNSVMNVVFMNAIVGLIIASTLDFKTLVNSLEYTSLKVEGCITIKIVVIMVVMVICNITVVTGYTINNSPQGQYNHDRNSNNQR